MDNKIIIQNKESIHHTSLGECKFIILKTLSGDKNHKDKNAVFVAMAQYFIIVVIIPYYLLRSLLADNLITPAKIPNWGRNDMD